MIYNALKKLNIVQEVSNDIRHKQGLERLGKGYAQAFRLNRFNPLTYIVLIITLLAILVMEGLKGVYQALNQNPFKWN